MAYATTVALAAEVSARKDADAALAARISTIEKWLKDQTTAQPPVSQWAPLSEPWFSNPPPPPADAATASLQAMIDRTPPGSVLNVAVGRVFPPDQINITRPIVLLFGRPGQPGASSIAPNTDKRQLIVFKGGGKGSTGSGSSGSVLEGLTIHGNGVQPGIKPPPITVEYGAVQIGGYEMGIVNGVTIRNCLLTDAAHDLINIQGGAGHMILGNDLDRAGKCCITGSGTSDWLVMHNRVAHYNTAMGVANIGDSSGMKLLVDGTNNRHIENEARKGDSRGFWWDSPSSGWTIDAYAYDAAFQGIFAETLRQSTIIFHGERNALDPNNQTPFGGDVAMVNVGNLDVQAFVKDSGGGVSMAIQNGRTDDGPHVNLRVHGGGLAVPSDRWAVYVSGDRSDPYFMPASNNMVQPTVISGKVSQ